MSSNSGSIRAAIETLKSDNLNQFETAIELLAEIGAPARTD